MIGSRTVRPSAALRIVELLVVAALGCARPVREGPPAAEGLSLPWTAETCAGSAVDADGDGMDDRCELALAQAFAPELMVDARDCLWTAAPSPRRLGGGYLFAAQRTAEGARLAFMPAYYRDCGWSGAACVLRGGKCGAHAGDSELIVVDVVPDRSAGRWRTAGVFLSAHCFGRSDGRCRWYRGAALRDFAWVDGAPFGAPRVWVALGKHGNYPSRRACDGGHWLYDSCDANRDTVRFPILTSAQNAGTRRHPLPAPDGCVASEALPLGAGGSSPGTHECPWDPSRPFRGWQADGEGSSTSYARYLDGVAGF